MAGFLAKAYQIFDNPAWSEICGWGEGGETVVIRKQIEFAQQILPLFFSHSNLQSFVRQVQSVDHVALSLAHLHGVMCVCRACGGEVVDLEVRRKG